MKSKKHFKVFWSAQAKAKYRKGHPARNIYSSYARLKIFWSSLSHTLFFFLLLLAPQQSCITQLKPCTSEEVNKKYFKHSKHIQQQKTSVFFRWDSFHFLFTRLCVSSTRRFYASEKCMRHACAHCNWAPCSIVLIFSILYISLVVVGTHSTFTLGKSRVLNLFHFFLQLRPNRRRRRRCDTM